MISDNGFSVGHPVFQEIAGPDGYIITKVPLKHIRFLDKADLERCIGVFGEHASLYAHYSDLIRDGAYANGVPIVYRTPRGNLFASDLRHSDIALYAERYVTPHASVPRNPIHPLISVKIIEVASREDIPVQRTRYLEKTR